jgi:hypothetical protein
MEPAGMVVRIWVRFEVGAMVNDRRVEPGGFVAAMRCRAGSCLRCVVRGILLRGVAARRCGAGSCCVVLLRSVAAWCCCAVFLLGILLRVALFNMTYYASLWLFAF